MILYPIWGYTQDGDKNVFNAFLRYGYQMKGLDMNNSTKKCVASLNPIWRTP